MRKTNPPEWVAQLDPSPDWALSSDAEDGGWQVEARWWGLAGDPPPSGPREVVIRPVAGITPDVLRRGVTSGVMRRMERLLGRLSTEMQQSEDASDTEYRAALLARIQQLPEGGPRSQPGDYYGALLGLFEEINIISDEPINDIASAMGVPKGTVKTQLRVARLRRAKIDER